MDKLNEESRRQFEEWIMHPLRGVPLGDANLLKRSEQCSDYYMHLHVEEKWKAWKQSRASIVVELPDADNYWNGTSGNEIFNHRQFAADSCDALRDIGLSIKGE